MPVISLLTDFGLRDGFVGAMKGVILRICPGAVIADISHDIAAQDIDEGAFVLRNAYGYFPPGTIHVAVVDPGVGSGRRALLVETERYGFVGPDNGLFSYIYRMEKVLRVIEITNRHLMLPSVSRTFHGRDVFAPVAGHRAAGVSGDAFGKAIEDYHRGTISEPVVHPDRIEGHILHIDHFGNLITDVSETLFNQCAAGRRYRITLGATEFDHLASSYAQTPVGQSLALFSSGGLLEIAVNGGSAAERLGKKRGATVQAHFYDTA